MATNDISGILVTAKTIEWTTIRSGKDGLQVAGSGLIELAVRKTEPVAEGAQADAAVPEILEAEPKNDFSAIKGQVTVGIASDNLLLRTVSLPLVEADELAGMVQLQVDKFSPFPIETMVVSHEVLEKRSDSCVVLIAAVKQEIVEEIGKTLKSGGLVPHRVDAAVLGCWRLLRDVGYAAHKGRELMFLLRGQQAELMALQDGIPIVFRSLGSGEGMDQAEFADDVAQAASQTLMSLELDHGAAGRCTISVWHTGDEPKFLIEGIKSSCGGGEIAFKSLDSLPHISEGLARRAAEQVETKLDLMPSAWRDAERSKAVKSRILVAVAAVLGLWLVFMLWAFGGLYVQNWRLSTLKAEKTALDKPAMEVRNIKERVRLVNRYMDRSKSSLECLRMISMLQPYGVDLSLSFTYRKGEGVKISGDAESANLVYDFKNKLDGSGFFTGSSLDGPRLDPRRGRELFDIDLKLPGGEQ
jgi:hypothetical protein